MWNPETWTTEALTQFLEQHWFVIVAAIIVIIIVIKVVKTVLKWLVIAAIALGLIVYSGYNIDDLTKVTNQAAAIAKDEVFKAMAGEAEQAEYTDHPDGSYTVKTPSLELSGFPNSGEVKVKLGGVTIGTWKLEGEIRDFVVKARAAARS